ncbi:asparaginase [Tetragenococcus koreensis]|uniref:asparaginase n=1 Tax=Tetragenococcus koreensis TaxID=290335 RepID=A0AAN4UCF9_9ENTE|nr:asparaginase [Tetragenococcus koreensis]MCF1585263.1 asparaginase [Tetragenococcus koreensis]MCF1614226.1 asparaginase [Tetragenococcus koreensis]MCF1618022.1 asparaginase [Tetragenococcus koreensis]MCF1622867.1 asparaginase [Tetragenococcus koreensis]MCF1624021.1 asparaginase [Tetragenococcus koreensis]
MKQILVLHTGGTIAMKEDQKTGSISPDVENPLLNASIDLPENVDLIVEDIFNLPSPHITPSHMLKMKQRIQKAYQDGIDSVVITHGTDTLEETAYFLDITIGDWLPIVLTGAMRSSNELGSDGLYNFVSAIRVAASPDAKNQGVLVVMNDEIHAARYVTKTHTTNVATFRTPSMGPVGMVNKNNISFLQKNVKTQHADIHSVNGLIPILKAYAGMNGELLEGLAHTQLDGLVIEALGAGNLPPENIAPLQEMLANQIPIVLVSRCFNGIAEPVYDYSGGGIELQKMGVIFCPNINSQKARLKLLIANNRQLTKDELADFMQH